MRALGAASGMLDVAMNAQGVTVERAYPRRIFSSLHAAFSFGALAGALSGGLVAEAGVPLTAHLLGDGRARGRGVRASFRVFLPDGDGAPRVARAEDERVAAGRARRVGAARRGASCAHRPAARAGAVALCTLLAEGALNDWSAVYLADVHDAGLGSRRPGSRRSRSRWGSDGWRATRWRSASAARGSRAQGCSSPPPGSRARRWLHPPRRRWPRSSRSGSASRRSIRCA